MNGINYGDFLEKHGVKATANRIVVAKALGDAAQPLSMSELEAKILTIDKSGIFRALMLFKEQHLVHVIEDGSSGVKYELCHSHNRNHDDDAHPHFHCEVCGRTFCIDSVKMPKIELPEGFVAKSVNHIVKGICHDCSMK